jgi:prevent-host-death family protein
MPTVGAHEFQLRFGEYQDKAQREPVEITRHGRRESVLMSAEHYDWLKAAVRRAHRTVETPEAILAAVERSEMDPEHTGSDDLLS